MHLEYKIIGGDGVEYGPALLEEIKGWIREGRIAAMTPIWRSDLKRWSPADRYTELHDDLARLYATTQARERPCGFWMRLCAFLLDRVFLLFLFLLVWTPVAAWRHWTLPKIPEARTDEATRQFSAELDNWFVGEFAPVYYPIFFLYDVLLNGRYGATLGKIAIGARIVQTNGAPIGYGRAALRWLGARISDFTVGLGYLLIAARPDKRALHDLLAGTKVVYRK